MESPMVDETSFKTVRKTRVIYVEETSDTDYRTSSKASPEVFRKENESRPAACQTSEFFSDASDVMSGVPSGTSAGLGSRAESPSADPASMTSECGGNKTSGPLRKHRSLDSIVGPPAKPQHHFAIASVPPWFNQSRDRVPPGVGRKKSLKAFQNFDDLKRIEDTLMYDKLKPLIQFMKLSGIFFVRKRGSFGKDIVGIIQSLTPLQVYCVCIVLVLLANCIRTLAAFDGNDGFGAIFFFKILTSIFAYEAMSRAFIAFWSCKNNVKGIRHIFLAMDRICFSDGIMPYEGPLRRTMLAFIGLSVAVSLADVAMTSWVTFFDGGVLHGLLIFPLTPDTTGVTVTFFKVFLVILSTLNSLVAMLSLTFYTCICYGLYKEFEYFSRTFSMKIRDDGTFSDDLEKFRLNHQKRCKLLSDVDQCLKYYIANTYLTNVPLMCVLLYSIVYTDDTGTAYRLLNTFKMAYVFLQMMTVSIAATIINSQAHAPLQNMYAIKVEGSSSIRQLEMTMFLNKLTGTSIGLTSWDMFVINKPTVLTVIGMVVTYFFLLVQFKNPLLGDFHCSCILDSNITRVVNSTLSLSHSI